jgi:DMSO reductase anchor subunit/ferredoxin
MENCPALAYTKDRSLNSIVHHANRCIGCKYCTWACPYDAPKYISQKGVVEKCTLCTNRLNEGLKPACANLCPTGALDFQVIELKEQQRIPGFTEMGINPQIKIIELRKKSQPNNRVQISQKEEKLYAQLQLRTPSKIRLKKEWALIPFTILVALLTAFFSAGVLGFLKLNPWLFLGAGVLALAFSSFHLGKKFRAWRSVLNIRKSWLSREILFFGLFLMLSAVWFLLGESLYIGMAGALAGFLCAYSVDKVYKVAKKITQLDVHSASVFLAALLFFSVFANNGRFIIIIFGLKVILYLYRKIYFIIHYKPTRIVLTIARIGFGFVVPVFLLWSQLKFSIWEPIMLSLLMGEIIDRIEFYMELEIITPQKQIEHEVANYLNNS